MRVAVSGLYVAVVVLVVVAWNNNAETAGSAFSGTAFLLWAAASLLVGMILGRPIAMLLPILAIPIAVPFGTSEKWLGSDAPLIPLVMAFEAPMQAAIVGLGVYGRLLSERIWQKLRRKGAPRD